METSEKVLCQIKHLTRQPETYLQVQDDAAKSFKQATKDLYDTSKGQDNERDNNQNKVTLLELSIDGFDDEQVWQQLELQNDDLFSRLVSQISRLVTGSQPAFDTAAHGADEDNDVTAGRRKVRKKKRSKQVHFSGDSSSEEEDVDKSRAPRKERRRKQKSSLSEDNSAEEKTAKPQKNKQKSAEKRETEEDCEDEDYAGLSAENEDEGEGGEEEGEEEDLEAILQRGGLAPDDSGSEEERMLQELLDRATEDVDPDASDVSGSDLEGDIEGALGTGFEAETSSKYDLGGKRGAKHKDNSDSDENDIDFNFDKNIVKKSKTNSESITKKGDKPKNKTDSQAFGKGSKKNKRKTEVDDKFFKKADMEEFLDREDAREARRQQEGAEGSEEGGEDEAEDIDLFGDIPSDEEDETDLKYADFFDPPEEEDSPSPKKESKKTKQDKKKPTQAGGDDFDDFFDDTWGNTDAPSTVDNKASKRHKASLEEGSEEGESGEGEEEDGSESMEEDEGVGEEEGEESSASDQQDEDYHEKEEEVEEGSENEEGEEEEEAEGAVKRKRQRRDLLSDSSEGEEVDEVLGVGGGGKSDYQQRKERLSRQIERLEDEAVAAKPWQVLGEAQGAARPINSLLENDLEFEQQTRSAPLITEETTKTLEQIIIQRIKDQTFDDVERKVKPKEEFREYKKRIELDQEKSKLSLAQVYEQEYLQQAEDKEEEYLDPQHAEVEKSMTSLFTKLDALCNFHYTPKSAIPDLEIVSNLPAITMEEVQPTTQSERTTLAPEEIRDKSKKTLKGETELTRTDKLRARRDKKSKQRAKEKRRLEREAALSAANPAMAKKIEAKKAMEQLTKQSKSGRGVTVVKDDGKKTKGLASSTQFFKQLQDEVTTHVRSNKAAASRTKNDKLKKRSAAKLKL